MKKEETLDITIRRKITQINDIEEFAAAFGSACHWTDQESSAQRFVRDALARDLPGAFEYVQRYLYRENSDKRVLRLLKPEQQFAHLSEMLGDTGTDKIIKMQVASKQLTAGNDEYNSRRARVHNGFMMIYSMPHISEDTAKKVFNGASSEALDSIIYAAQVSIPSMERELEQIIDKKSCFIPRINELVTMRNRQLKALEFAQAQLAQETPLLALMEKQEK